MAYKKLHFPILRVALFLLLCAGADAGILVSQTDHGFQFTEAVSITVNGKDRAYSLGDHPQISGQLSKLSAAHLTGTLLRDAESGVIAHYENGKAEYLAPQGLPKTAPADAPGMWKASRISYKRSAADKTGDEIAASAFVAFLPAGPEDLTRLCMDPAGLEFAGGQGKGFATQISLMPAVVRAYPGNPAMAPLEKYVGDAMRSRYQQFESGAAGIDALTQGLKFVELSKAVYPDSPEQEKLRRPLVERKIWLDRKIAILKAFAAGGQWDALLLGDREFERFRAAFPEVSAQHTQALTESLRVHMQAGAKHKQDGDYGSAFREFHLAGLRKPSDAALREDALQAWTEYSRRAAADQRGNRAQLSAGVRNSVDRYLDHADRYKQEKNLDEALKSVLDAESALQKNLAPRAISAESLKVLYKKADILGAQERIAEALISLDQYDLCAVDEERAPADKLRNQLLFNLNSALKNIRTAIQAAWKDSNFEQVRQLTSQGLKVQPGDPDLLYYAGMASVIRRQPKEGRDFLTRYLEASNTLDANAEQRMQAQRLLATIAGSPGAVEGDPNWMSGNKLPGDEYYDPMSLAFQPRIDRIEASNKLRVAFDWDGGKLRSITPSFEKNERVTGEKKISFSYEGRVPQVSSATDDADARLAAPANPDEAYKSAVPLLPNHPLVDPLAIQRMNGQNLLLGIAGNRFFHPFVWEKLYYFRLTYDDAGRVVRAQELTSAKGNPAEEVLEFEWSGSRLLAIRGYIGKTKNYERTMQYQEGRLVGEEIQGAGKPSRIKYTYLGARLAAAETTADATVDNRSRKVTFLNANR